MRVRAAVKPLSDAIMRLEMVTSDRVVDIRRALDNLG
jgi:hypothetical protein